MNPRKGALVQLLNRVRKGMDIMTKKEFEDLIGNELDDYWLERIIKIYDTFEDITAGDLSEIWQNDSLCVTEDLYESACKVDAIKNERDCLESVAKIFRDEKDRLESEISKLRKEKADNRIEISKAECVMLAYLAKIDELETQLQQYKAFVADIKKAMNTELLCLCKDGVCVSDIFVSYGM